MPDSRGLVGVRDRAWTYARLMPSYTFERWVNDVKVRVRMLSWRVSDPNFGWPGLLLLDVPEGISAEAFELGDSVEREHLGNHVLPERIRASRARRFCWVMPVRRESGGKQDECLLLVIGERGRVTASLCVIERSQTEPPRLGPFSDGAFGAGARRVSGRFVEPLLAALSEPDDLSSPGRGA